MEDYLYQKDLWRLLEGKCKKLTTMSSEDWDILDRKALGSICLCLEQSMTFNIMEAKTTKELMQTLAKLQEKPSTSNNVFLMRHLLNMKMAEGGFVADHLNEFNTVTSQLSSVGINFDEEIRALLILFSFLESWNSLVMAMSNSISRSNTLNFDDVVSVILSEKTHRKKLGGSTLGKSKGKRSQSRGPKNCQYCGKPRHKKKYCKTQKNNEVENKDGNDAGASWVQE